MNPFAMHGRRRTTQTLASCLATPGAGSLATGLSSGRRRWLLGDRTDQAVDEHPALGQHVRTDELARLEAAMFLAREPLTTRRLAKLARLPDGTRARVLLRELRRLHDASGAAFRVEHIAGGYQLLTRGPFGPWVRRLLDQPSASRLSAAALETLAIVAYRQPVTRAEIEAIRGVGSEEMLRHLLERDFVAVGGRAEDLGRPNVYVTTRRFLGAFGLARIEDLPAVESGPGNAEGNASETAADGV
jgi:segregation and condensation protein B